MEILESALGAIIIAMNNPRIGYFSGAKNQFASEWCVEQRIEWEPRFLDCRSDLTDLNPAGGKIVVHN